MLRLFMRFLAVGVVAFGAVPGIAQSETPPGNSDTSISDSLRVQYRGMNAMEKLDGTTLVVGVEDGYEIYRVHGNIVSVDTTGPDWERNGAEISAGSTPKSVCLKFNGKEKLNYCMDVVLNTDGTGEVTRKGMMLPAEAFYDKETKLGKAHKMPKEMEFNVHLQTECMCFKEIERESRKGNFRDIMEKTEPDGNEWYEQDEPFFNAELRVQPWYKPCLVNEGQNMIFCEVEKIWNTTPEKETAYLALLNGLLTKCFGRKADGPAPDRKDPLRMGNEWLLRDDLQMYAMLGAKHSTSKDGPASRLFLVTFNIGKLKKK